MLHRILLTLIPILLITTASPLANAQPAPTYTIHLPAGTFAVNLKFDGYDLITIEGQGPATVLQPQDPSSHAISITHSSNVTIQNLAIDGRWSAGATADPTYFRGIENLTIRNVAFTNSYHRAINIRSEEPNTNVTIDQCSFTANHRDAIYAGNVSNLLVTRNRIFDAPNDTAIDVGERVSSVHIQDNLIQHARSGILVTNDYLAPKRLDSIIIAGNIITNTRSAIQIRASIDKTADASISDNIIHNATWAIRILASNVTIRANIISNASNQPIYIQGNDIALTDNLITGASANWAIMVIGKALHASGNQLSLAGAKGFLVSGDQPAIIANTFYDTNRIIQLQNASHCHVAANTAHGSTGGIFLIDSSYSIIQSNAFFQSNNNSDIVEAGSSDFNRIRHNTVTNRYGVTIVGPNTLAIDNDWWTK